MQKKLKEILVTIKKDVSDYKYGIFMVILYFLLCMLLFKKVCIVRILTGFPCPGCGLTRAVCELFKLNLKGSLAYNPVALLWIFFIVYFFVNRYILNNSDKVMAVLLICVSVITIAVYFYRMYRFFPDGKSLVYDKKNIFAFFNRVWYNYRKYN